ncbi:replicative DNA helicase [Chthoniobacter flavus Ellin428]|uniref:Replicative DNA helicase n=1 Tax=Chthoniobacter flavus Ellin428 TaxID=497964 RepID=B4DC28_9BACT|nr:replicative DNA helicase [Chthoniobacter flavus]EDY16002.1 replicative DNA helicase [Chthoniobacter flavus Ellin428]
MASEASSKSAKPSKKGADSGDFRQNESYRQDTHRLFPQSAIAEKGVISSFLLSPREIGALCGEQKITKEHFHLPAHASIYACLLEMWDKGKPIDLITVTQLLQDQKQLDQSGGAAYVSELFTYLPTAANAEHYIEILVEKHTLREIIKVCTEYAARCYDEQDVVATLLDSVEQGIFKISQSRYQAKSMSMKDQVMQAIHSIEELYDRRGAITGLPTGFAELDKMTDGLHGAEMIVIAARPSMGKTALAMNIAEHIALEAKHAVAVFSLEMSTSQLVQRLLCSRARVNLGSIRNGFLSERDFPALTSAAAKLAESKIFIDDTPGLSILELRAKARRLKSQHDIRAIFIDYLQLLRSTSRRAQDNRQLEIAEISSGIKSLAKELNIPIVVLAQLNRNPESRSGESKGRPRLSDLRESGSIEQDADVVGLLVREEYYAENEEDKKESEGKATLIIAKQRSGPVGDCPLTFLKEFTRFENRAREADGEED